jgi:allophanate hydrolase
MNTIDNHLDLRLDVLRQQYAQRSLLPSECMARVLVRIDAVDRPEVWIARVPAGELLEQARALDRLLQERQGALPADMPLFGVPFAVKDNIDVAGMPTTVGCPAFAYVPQRSAAVVEKLLAAGAILIGKTNLDQFATGLVGVRSPYGAVRNALDPAYVSGGSSSGSAVAVALSLVSFALGTDTAGSGRVPAGFNEVVGLKPSRGLLSTRGVFPACRTLDCVSVFARSVGDAWQVTHAVAGFDPLDPYSRALGMLGVKRRGYRIAVPDQLEFHGDAQAEAAFRKTLDQLKNMPDCEFGTVDFAPFHEAAQLLYQGPWVAERLAAVGDFFDVMQQEMHPVVAAIIGQGKRFDAVDAFTAQYRLAGLKRCAELALQDYDFLVVPTAPTLPRIADVESEPVKCNAQLGHYTNFVNFFDMAALAIPGMRRADGLPAGITLVGPCGSDHRLAAAAQDCLMHGRLPAGAETTAIVAEPLGFAEPTVLLAVVGAHLVGQPLNWQLVERGARRLETTRTSAHYRLYALASSVPPKPGLLRVAEQGAAIEIEIWQVPARTFGDIVAEVPPPLAIGSLETADGRWVKGFVCEPYALAAATDITHHGGWRPFLASRS